jgi:nucleotide-binding universal stress UspA family protein
MTVTAFPRISSETTRISKYDAREGVEKAIAMIDTQARMQLRNMLFPTDFSLAANAALPYAAEIARRYGAKLYTVHVLPRDTYAMTPPETWPPSVEVAMKGAKQQAHELLSPLEGVNTEVLVRSGDVATVIDNLIEAFEIDLVVLGTHGRTGWGKVLLGSVAETIFRKAPCPVITVGPHCSRDPKHSVQFRQIVFATNFSMGSRAAEPYAVSFAQENQAKLTLLHVVEEPKSGLGNPDQLVPPELPMLCRIVEGGVAANKIIEIAAGKQADLIILGVHPPRPLHADTHLPMTTAHKVVLQAPCPVLTVRGPDDGAPQRQMVGEDHPTVNVPAKLAFARSGDAILR